MKTKVINLFGGSGCGKSTTACGIFYFMKMKGYDVELVREYVKGWAWEGKKVGPYDQPYLFGKQLKLESSLYGKVNYIVTDSPLLLSPVYEEFYTGNSIVEQAALDFLNKTQQDGIEHLNFFIKRTKPFKQAGRYETEETARKVDSFVQQKMYEWNKELIHINVDDDQKPYEIIKYMESL